MHEKIILLEMVLCAAVILLTVLFVLGVLDSLTALKLISASQAILILALYKRVGLT